MVSLYSLVARGTVVMTEFSAVTGNVARRILEKLPAEADSRLCFSQDRYVFHLRKENPFVVFGRYPNEVYEEL